MIALIPGNYSQYVGSTTQADRGNVKEAERKTLREPTDLRTSPVRVLAIDIPITIVIRVEYGRTL